MKFLNVMSSSCSYPKTGQKGFWMSMAGLWHLSCWTFMYILKSMHLTEKKPKNIIKNAITLLACCIHSSKSKPLISTSINSDQPAPPRQTTHHSLHLDTLCDWCWCGAIKAWAQNRLRVFDGFSVFHITLEKLDINTEDWNFQKESLPWGPISGSKFQESSRCAVNLEMLRFYPCHKGPTRPH